MDVLAIVQEIEGILPDGFRLMNHHHKFNLEDYNEVIECLNSSFIDYRMFEWIVDHIPQEEADEQKKKEMVFEFTNFASKFSVERALRDGFVVMYELDGKVVGTMSICLVNGAHNIFQKAKRFFKNAKALWAVGLPPFVISPPFSGMNTKIMAMDLDPYRYKHVGKRNHLWLMQVGVVREIRGQKIGTKLLDVLEQISDKLELGAWLETDEARLKKFYERHQFKVLEEYTLSVGGKYNDFEENYGMFREPQKE